jgi:NAD(P)-dependent dehydrogenase (short-subunit alcohol dehydrogenase family)
MASQARVARAGGAIINVASMAGMIGFAAPPMAAHAAANAGLIGLTRQLAVEGAPVGIRVVSISPGAIVKREADMGLLNGRQWPIALS